MHKRILLRSQLKRAWSRTIKGPYCQQVINSESGGAAGDDDATDPLTAILERANLPETSLTQANAICTEIRNLDLPFPMAARSLISWAIVASCKKGRISAAQAKKLAVSAIKVCRELQGTDGAARGSNATSFEKQIREFGLVSLFAKGEIVTRNESDKQYVVVSVFRSRGKLKIAPADNPLAGEQVEPHELCKDPIEGFWPAELAD